MGNSGYKKPPEHCRFKKGQSGNPKGRPKGSKGLTAWFQDIMHRPVHAKENGKIRKMTGIEAILYQQRNAALAGDKQAIKEVLRLQQILEFSGAVDDVQAIPHELDMQLLKGLRQRLSTATSNTEERESDVDPK